MSKKMSPTFESRPVEIKDVDMPMIDDYVEEVNGLRAPLPLGQPAPNTVQEAIREFREAKNAGEILSAGAWMCGLLCAKLCTIIFFGFFAVGNIYVFLLGVIHLNDCPIDRRIPIFLIVVGLFGIARMLLNWYYRLSDPEGHHRATLATGVMDLFLVSWLGSGAAWVFSKEPNFDDPESKRYCHKLTYNTAFVYLCLLFAFILFVLCVLGITGFYKLVQMCVEKSRAKKEAAALKRRRRPSGIV